MLYKIFQIYLIEYSLYSAALAIDCLQTNSAGGKYTGLENTTISGLKCLPWKALERCGQILPDKKSSLAENFCRNPDPDSCHQDKRNSPWCYTGTQNHQWEYCDVPVCDGQSESCSSALGMGNGSIADRQITASSFDSSGHHAPHMARINRSNSKHWAPGCCSDRNFLKIDLLVPHVISKLHVQGTRDGYYVTAFNVLYSLDDLLWSAYSDTADGAIKEFKGNLGNNIVPIYFNRPFTAVKIAIVPRSWNSRPGLRLEIFGCKSKVKIPRGTEVTQNIQTSSVEWTRENSPYVVRQRISVAAGSTLTIHAGVNVVFIGKESGLNVTGCLKLNGRKGNEVRFLSNNPLNLVFNSDMVGNPFWQGIAINSVSTLCPDRKIGNAIIHGANIGISLGLNADSFRLSNVAVRCCQKGLALNLTGSGTAVSIASSVFESNQHAVAIKLSGNTTITSTIFRNNSYAIMFEVDSPPLRMEQEKSLEIYDSTFTENAYGLFSQTIYYGNYSLILRLSKNKFSRSQIYVYNVVGSCDLVLKAEIDECEFVKGHIVIDVCQNYSLQINNSKLSETSTFLVGNCRSLTISNNEFSEFNGQTLTISTYPSGFRRIYNNRFVQNEGLYCISLTTEYRQNFPPGQISITGNVFRNNSVNTVIYIREEAPSDIQLNGNTFENPLSRYDLYQATPWKAGYLVDASGNWWGGSDFNVTLSRIYDFYTDFQLAMVEVSSIYKEPEMVTIIDTSSSRDLKFGEIIVGGRLRQNTSIDLRTVGRASIIDVIGPIHVPRNMELKLIGSKILNFATNAGILVEGVLSINGGQRSNKLQLKPKIRDGQWDGIRFVNSKGSRWVNVDLRGLKYELKLRNSSLTVVNSSLELSNGISSDGFVPMTLEISDSEISSSNRTSVVMDVNSKQVTLSLVNSRIIARNYNDGIAITAYSSISLTMDNSSVLVSPYRTAVSVNPRQGHTNITTLTAIINRSLVEGSIAIGTIYTNFSASGSTFRSSASNNSLIGISTNFGLPNSMNVTLRNSSLSLSEGGQYTLSIDNPNGPGTSVRLQQNSFNGKLIYVSLIGPTILDISSNIFNSSMNGPVEIQLKSLDRDGAPSTENRAVQIRDNVFAKISGDRVILLGCTSRDEYFASIRIEGNTFVNNLVSNILASDCRGLYLTRNTFLVQSRTIAYRTSVPLSSGVVLYATGNFWNASNYGDVAARVFDQQDDPSLSPIEISPWFNDINMTVFGKAESPFFRNERREIGGKLTENTTLQKTNQAYIVVKDIYVPFGITLEIEDGVQLDFRQGGITVEGMLIAVGRESSWITMKAESEANTWRGVNFQRQFVDEIYRHDSDWWEVYVQSQWRTLEYRRTQEVRYMKRLADILCKQAGYSKAGEYGPYNCSANATSEDETPSSTPPPGTEPSGPSSLSGKSPPCSDLSQRTLIHCNLDAKILPDCTSTKYGNSENSLLRLECLPSAATDIHIIIYKMVNGAGDEVVSTPSDGLVLARDPAENNSLSSIFVSFRPCLGVSAAVASDCVSFMSLAKSGWFVRHLGPTQLILEPKSNPTNSSTFLEDSSFIIRRDRFTLGSVAFESLNLPDYFVSVQNDLKRSLVLQRFGSFMDESASFRLIEQNPSVRRRKRQTSSGTELSKKSHMKFVRISRASVGITVEGESPLLENIAVENSTGSGIVQRGYASGNFTIADSKISFNGGTGISLTTYDYDIHWHHVNIVGCEIVGNAGHGLGSLGRKTVTVTQCLVSRSGLHGISVEVSKESSLTAIVDSSRIFDNFGTAVSCYGRCLVRNNSFAGNKAGCVFIGTGRPFVDNNTFEDNGVTGSPDALFSASSGSTVEFINNVVRRNRYRTAVYLNNINEDVVINGNTFVNNSRYRSGASGNDSVIELDYIEGMNVSITGNYFDDPSAGNEIQINSERGNNYGQLPFNLSFNFWNRQNYSGIIKRISCFFNDMQKRPVNIWPAVLNPETSSLLTIPDDNGYFFQDGTGGDVYTSLVIPFRKQPYTIERSIYVDIGATLTIEAGVVLKFKSGRGIFVKGTLILEGSAESPVTFTGFPGTGWGGFILMQPFSNLTSGIANLSHLIIEGSPTTVIIPTPTITTNTPRAGVGNTRPADRMRPVSGFYAPRRSTANKKSSNSR